MERRSIIIKFIIFIILIALAVYLFNFTEFGRYIKTAEGRIETSNNINSFVNSYGVYAPLIFILIYTVGSAILFPGVILTFIGAILFGTSLGTLYNLVGATIGAILCFLIAKNLGHKFIDKIIRKRYHEFDRLVSKSIEKSPFKAIFVLRLIPLVPYNALNLVSGLTKISLKDYSLATFFGMIPGAFIYTYLFATLGEKVFTGVTLNDILTKEVILALSLFIILMLIPLLLKKLKKKVL